jgi:hypothetical protein
MNEDKSEIKTLLVGATTNTLRYAYIASKRLNELGFDFIPIGIKKGNIFGKEIQDLRSKPELKNIHTITLYLGESNQSEWLEYLLSLNPKRIIFNPGAENHEFLTRAHAQGIEAFNACSLVMLSSGQF